jgi:CBS domain-containing protein
MLRSDQDGVQQETVAPVDLNIESAARSDNSRLARRTQKPESALSTLAGDLMSSPAITASAADPVSLVARRMLRTGVNGMPVVDASGVPVGMVSDGDLIGRRGDRRDWWLEMLATGSPQAAGFSQPVLSNAVHEVMSSPLITIAHTASIKDIAEALQAHRVKRLPVLEKGRLVGVVSRADLLRIDESIPPASLPKESVGGGLLEFLESMIGGASLRGGLERAEARGEDEPSKEEKPAPRILSAADLREEVNAYKRKSRTRSRLSLGKRSSNANARSRSSSINASARSFGANGSTAPKSPRVTASWN